MKAKGPPLGLPLNGLFFNAQHRSSRRPGGAAYTLDPEIPSARLDARDRPRFDDRCVSDFASGTIRSSQMLLVVAYVSSATPEEC